MKNALLLSIAIVGLAAVLVSQSGSPIPAPDDVSLNLEIEGGSNSFRLGELIPVRYSYSATSSGKYFQVGSGIPLVGRRAFEISCVLGSERISRNMDRPRETTFERILTPCGIGGGVGGGCGDCSGEIALSPAPLRFSSVPLNHYVHFIKPGHYQCEATSAEITAKPRSEPLREALLLKSSRVELDLVEDAAWAHQAAFDLGELFRRECRHVEMNDSPRLLRCFDVAKRLTYLDTVDALAIMVRETDGTQEKWGSGFPEAIRDSRFAKEALRLMAARMQQPDFLVKPETLRWLASTNLRQTSPEAFTSENPAAYRTAAQGILRNYVRLLGQSLANKQPDVLTESLKTYRQFAEDKLCAADALISETEERGVIASVKQ